MKSATLTVEPRTLGGKKVAALRAEGKIPGVVYGPKEAPTSIMIERVQLEKTIREAGESTVITLSGLSTPKEVLIHDVAFDPARGGVIHVDFYAIEAGKEITVNVPLEFVGEAPAVKLGGTLTKVLHEIEVTCMPKDLPQQIEVDVSGIVDFETHICVKDLKVGSNISVHNEPEDIVALVQAVEEDVAGDATLDMSAIEVEKKGKTEEA